MTDLSRISENLKRVQTRIRNALSARDATLPAPQLIAVSKTRSAEAVRQAYDAGARQFGENYLQEALQKIDDLQDLPIEWHFIGAVQSNKTADISAHFDWLHTLDRLKIARRLSDQRPQDKKPLQVLIQVNIDDEQSKAGIAESDIKSFADQISQFCGIQLRGLMAIPAPQTSYQLQLATAQRMFALLQDLQRSHAEVDTLSLGMSADLEAAIAAGANMVRVGTDIFGPRD